MPFIYRRAIANIDRFKRRDDKFIHENIVTALSAIHSHTRTGYIKILPTDSRDPPIKKADPKNFLTLYATRILDLNLCEVEHWLDNFPTSDDEHTFSMNKTSRAYIDERRMYYRWPEEPKPLLRARTEQYKSLAGPAATRVIYRP